MPQIQRLNRVALLKSSIRDYSVTALVGPRQCGKTTLAHMFAATMPNSTFLDMENPVDAARLANPMSYFETVTGLIIIDEIQLRPEIMPVLRVLADKKPLRQRFLVLGSASPELIRGSSESLAGRIHFIEMSGFTLAEVGTQHMNPLWVRGSFPKSYLAKSTALSLAWRNDFIRTFVERDILQMGLSVPAVTLRRFWSMVAHYHGQLWNASEIGNSLGVSHVTAKRYIDALTSAGMVRQLPAYHENAGKRLVKSPKVYVRDSGIVHTFMNITTYNDLLGHPKLGASWEGFAIEQVLSMHDDRNAYFWRTQNGAELDLLLLDGGKRHGYEFKFADAPVLTKSMHVALDDLALDALWIVYPGTQRYRLAPKCECVPLAFLVTK